MIEVLRKKTLHANLSVGGDKSITIRAILLGAIAQGATQICGALISEDTLAAIDCAKLLGAAVKVDGENITVLGSQKINDGKTYDCKNSGTLARLLIGLLSGIGVNATVVGDESLSVRPMDRVCEPLKKRGAKIEYNGKTLPVKIFPSTLKDFEYEMPVDSAQVKSAILLSGVFGSNKTVVKEKNSTRDHTEKMLAEFGLETTIEDKKISIKSGGLKGRQVDVPSDPSSAAFYLALGLSLGEVTVKNVLLTDSRAGFHKKLATVGAKFEYNNERENYLGKIADLTAFKSEISYFEVCKNEIASSVDEIPLLAVVGFLNRGCKIMGASELRKKESDRLLQTKLLIESAGGKVEIIDDDLIVEGKSVGKAFEFSSDDHRMTMCAFVLMTVARGGKIYNEKSVDISFPKFFENFNALPLGLIGRDLSRSKSGIVHKFILSAFGVSNFTFECNSIKEDEFEDFLKKCPYKAFNATIPYKTMLFSVAEKRDERAVIGCSSNYFLDHVAYTTDGEGLLLALKYYRIDIENKKVLICGTGGAGRSIAVSLAEKNAKVFVKNRTAKKAEEFCLHFKKARVFGGEKCDLLINATSVIDSVIFSKEEIENASAVVDINYGKESATLEYCKKQGKKVFDGKAMLFFQAYVSDCLLLQRKIDENEALSLYKKYLVEYEN